MVLMGWWRKAVASRASILHLEERWNQSLPQAPCAHTVVLEQWHFWS